MRGGVARNRAVSRTGVAHEEDVGEAAFGDVLDDGELSAPQQHRLVRRAAAAAVAVKEAREALSHVFAVAEWRAASTVDRGRWTADRGPWAMGRGPRTVDRGPWAVDRGPWTVDRGSWTVGRGPRTVGRGPQTMDCGPWTMDRGPWPTAGEDACGQRVTTARAPRPRSSGRGRTPWPLHPKRTAHSTQAPRVRTRTPRTGGPTSSHRTRTGRGGCRGTRTRVG